MTLLQDNLMCRLTSRDLSLEVTENTDFEALFGVSADIAVLKRRTSCLEPQILRLTKLEALVGGLWKFHLLTKLKTHSNYM